jgi:hypothetical protein
VNPDRAPVALGVLVGGIGPIVVAAALVPFRDSIESSSVALVLVVVVVLGAMLGGRPIGALAALSAALSFDFFFTVPFLSLTIDSADDIETTLLLLVVALIVGQLASRAARSREAAEAGRSEIASIHRIADMAAQGRSGDEVIAAARQELTGLLGLARCQFEPAPFGLPRPRLERSGAMSGQIHFRAAGRGFELPDEGAELPVLSHGQQVGRFLLDPTPGVGVTLEQRVVAVAIADQVGAALAVERAGTDRGADPQDPEAPQEPREPQ